MALCARLYYDAFQISILPRRPGAREGVCGEEGIAREVVCEGEDGPDTLRVKGLIGESGAAWEFRGVDEVEDGW